MKPTIPESLKLIQSSFACMQIRTLLATFLACACLNACSSEGAQFNSPSDNSTSLLFSRPRILNEYSTEWQYALLEQGTGIAQTNTFTELADGLNFMDVAGTWHRTREEFVGGQGGFSAESGLQKLKLPQNLNAIGSVQATLADGFKLRFSPLALAYYDPASGDWVLLAQAQDAFPQQTARNTVLYPNAFKEIHASVRYVYQLRGFHQDVILHESPPPPEAFKLSGHTRLVVWTEFAPETQDPLRNARVIRSESDPLIRAAMVEPDFIDESLYFGRRGMIGIGEAFGLPKPADPHSTVPVGKKYIKLNGKKLLLEGVEYRDIRPYLHDLPQAAIQGTERVSIAQAEAALAGREALGRTVFVSKIQADQGFVIDAHVVVPSSASSYTFQSGQTYYVSSGFGVGPNETIFQNGTFIKYKLDAYLLMSGPISSPPRYGSAAVLTAKDDNDVGVTIHAIPGENQDSSDGIPEPSAAQALWVYFVDFNTTLENFTIRWAKTAIQYVSNGTNATHAVKHGLLWDSTTGIYNNASFVTLEDVSKRNVIDPTPLPVNGGTTSGTVTEDAPDMIFLSDWMNTDTEKPVVTNLTFSANDCSVSEGTVKAGTRKLLRFGVGINNVGTGHFYGERDSYRRVVSGYKEPPSANCHGHCHLTDWTKYELFDLNGNPANGVFGVGKLGWSLYDRDFPGCVPGTYKRFPPPNNVSCETVEMGLSANYCDYYERTTVDQWLDVTDVIPGTYRLRISLDFLNKRYEANGGNNVHDVTVMIP